jgi:hypothetical protein
MSFNGVQSASGPYFLAPGGATIITIWYGNPGDDMGAQWIMAHPITDPTQPPATLQVDNFCKILDYQIGNTQGVYSDPFYQYSVMVTNVGQSGVNFNVQGGGNT